MASSDVLRRFSRHAKGRPGIEPDVVTTAIDFKRDYLGDPDPTCWLPGDLSTLLLELFPAKVLADDEWFASVVPTLRLYVTFLRDTKALHWRSAPPRVLLAELDEAGAEAQAAARDPRKFGLGKSVFSAMGADVTDPASLQAVMDAFNALPFEQRKAITDPAFAPEDDLAPESDDPEFAPSFPPVMLPPADELAEAALASPLVGRLLRLVEWVGPRRDVTRRGALRLPDAREAARHLGLPIPQTPRPRSLHDLPELSRLWGLAREGGFVVAVDGTAGPGPLAIGLAHDTLRPEDVVELYGGLVDACLDHGLGEPTDPVHTELESLSSTALDDLLTATDEAFYATIPQLYGGAEVSRAALERDAVEAAAETISDDAHRITPELREQAVAHRLRDQLDQLLDLGALTVDGDRITATGLGRAGLREVILSSGIDAPLVDDPASMDAAALLETLGDVDESLAEPLVISWLAARTPDEAAADLVDVARSGSAVDRVTAMSMLSERLTDHVQGEGRALIESLAEDPMVGPYVGLVLLGEDAAPTAAQRQWIALDAVAFALDTGQLDDGSPDDELWEMVTAFADLETAWRSEHPQLLEILEAVASHHPVGRVRKAAKKALFKFRQRLASG